jgi:succinate dehydrogenase / fumarate reductase membrane anchor subunit
MKNDTTTIRSPLGRARGLGSAKDGTHHWWVQRLSGIAMILPMIYLLWNIDRIVSPDYDALLVWLKQPVPAMALVLFIASSFYHANLGIQVVIEDYVHCEGSKFFWLVLTKLFFFFLGFAAIFAVVRLNFGI